LNPNLDTARQHYFDGDVGATINALQILESRSRNDHLLLQQIAAGRETIICCYSKLQSYT